MHVRVRLVGKPEAIVVVESKLTKIEKFRKVLEDKFALAPKLQRLFYGGKLLEDGYTFHDYNIKLNDVIQVIEQMQVKEIPNQDKKGTNFKEDSIKKGDIKVEYKDAESVLYAIGDLIDMRDREQGAWFEGKIVRIVHHPNAATCRDDSTDMETGSVDPEGTNKIDTDKRKTEEIFNTDNDLENKPPEVIMNGENSKSKKGITKYFRSTSKKGKKKEDSTIVDQIDKTDENLLYKVQLDGEEDDSDLYCKLSEIRPRARVVIDIKDLKKGQTVMVNYNTEDPLETGYWYDFKIVQIEKLRTSYKLLGTIYLGPEAIPQNDTSVSVRDKIYAIEEPVPLNQRTDEHVITMTTPPEKRSLPLNCLSCRDDEDVTCKDCGCFLCSGKEFPEKIVLCDECNRGYHMACLSPPLTDLPEEDWYCPSCKRDPNHVIAPGAAKQTKKASTKSNRDWGRGMACVGKTKTCAMPANHFGPIPGIEVGMCWRFRIQLSESGVHRPPVSGIHGRDVEGAYSIVLSGGYEDDVDNGNEFTYTGSGGRDLSGNKRTAEQSCDQTLTRENKALARNCAVKKISEEGGDAGENWREGRPVRVVRSYKMLKHFPKYAPKEGIRYDGIYKVVKYYPEKGLSGYIVWKYQLRRDDPSPAPWEPEAKRFPIVYPDGYLEAEAEKKALKEKTGKGPNKETKKRALRDSNHTIDTESESECSPPSKKSRGNAEPVKKKGRQAKKSKPESPKTPEAKSTISQLGNLEAEAEKKALKKKTGKDPIKETKNRALRDKAKKSKPEGSKTRKAKNQSIISHLFTKSPPKTPSIPLSSALSDKELEVIEADTLNAKLWKECLKICETQGKKQFVEYVTQAFLCIICQEVAASPVTTHCLHNFCLRCLKQAFKATGTMACPCCRNDLSKFEPQQNEHLTTALRSILAGYDAGKK